MSVLRYVVAARIGSPTSVTANPRPVAISVTSSVHQAIASAKPVSR